MIHYSCDRCKRELDPHDQMRYVIRMECRAAMDLFDTDSHEDERDHLLDIQEILENSDALEDDEIGADVYQQMRFDLCPACYRQFIKNPVGREPIVEFDFSEN